MKEKSDANHTGNPEKAYADEWNNKSTGIDTNAETAARDTAKIEKVHTGQTQKIDSIDENDMLEDNESELIKRENEIDEKE